MLDRHAVQALARAKVAAREIAEQLQVSVRTVRRIIREAATPPAEGADVAPARPMGRPQVTEAVRARVRALVLDDPDRPPGEICRLLKAEGTPLGLSTVYRVLTAARATIPTALQSASRASRASLRNLISAKPMCAWPMGAGARCTSRRIDSSTRGGSMSRWCRMSASKR